MKTSSYNPSQLEIDFANALHEVCGQIEKKLTDYTIDKVECDTHADNPFVKFYLTDNDNDPHEIVMKIIQLPDQFS
jgi:hypothetical protein